MELTIPNPYGVTASSALDLARERELLPGSWGTSQIRELSAALRERAVFSARTTDARYLQAVKDRVQRYLSAGYKGDLTSLRVELKQELARLGYHPERGFPGDEKLGIPPAKPGSLRDLSSDQRINLILNTQLRLMTGRAQRASGMRTMALLRYPAWELVRTEGRAAPRAWERRWVEAGGNLYNGRMIAFKADPVWQKIGSSALFDDALDVDHPPFAFNSGMGWDQVKEDECRELGVTMLAPTTSSVETPTLPEPAPAPVPQMEPKPMTVDDLIPPAVAINDGLDLSILTRLKASLGAALTAAKKIVFKWFGGKSEINAPVGADLSLLLPLAELAAIINSGTSKGAKEGWETRRRGRRVEEEQKDMVRRGKEALQAAQRKQGDLIDAMKIPGVGTVDFLWGHIGDRAPDKAGRTHKDGWGLSHILDKRGQSVLDRLPEVLARGKVLRHDESDRRFVELGDARAILLRKDMNRNAWRVESLIIPWQDRTAQINKQKPKRLRQHERRWRPLWRKR